MAQNRDWKDQESGAEIIDLHVEGDSTDEKVRRKKRAEITEETLSLENADLPKGEKAILPYAFKGKTNHNGNIYTHKVREVYNEMFAPDVKHEAFGTPVLPTYTGCVAEVACPA